MSSNMAGKSMRLANVESNSCGGEIVRPAKDSPRRSAGRPVSLGRNVSLFIRRTHMYVGLFVTPWLVMYALSTIAFNHAGEVDRLYRKIDGPTFDNYVIERRLSYGKMFAMGTTLRTRAEEILTDLNLNGSFGVENAEDRLVITRRDPFVPRRVTFYPSTHRLVVERQNSRMASFLTTLHTQVSYANKLKRIKAWAIFVDLTIATMVMLVFSGIWMWWELKVTRLAGSLFILAGAMLFSIFVFLA